VRCVAETCGTDARAYSRGVADARTHSVADACSTDARAHSRGGADARTHFGRFADTRATDATGSVVDARGDADA
jgi:hypothetical protein